MSLDLTEAVIQLADSKQTLKHKQAAVAKNRRSLEQRLRALRDQCVEILNVGNIEDGFEVAFLDEALADVRASDRQDEVLNAELVGQTRLVKTLETLVEVLKK